MLLALLTYGGLCLIFKTTNSSIYVLTISGTSLSGKELILTPLLVMFVEFDFFRTGQQ